MNLLWIATLVVVFWVGMWGILDHFVQQTRNPLVWYSAMVGLVVLIVTIRPALLEHFV